ncbi:hypothetical protein Ahia01_001243700 [Argonauta hians]
MGLLGSLKMLYRCNIDYKVWDMKSGYSDHVIKSKEEVQDTIKKKTGLRLDYVNSAGGKGGTSTDGKQGRRFYSDELTLVIGDLLSTRCNLKHKQNILTLHKQLILRIVSVSLSHTHYIKIHWNKGMPNLQGIGSYCLYTPSESGHSPWTREILSLKY